MKNTYTLNVILTAIAAFIFSTTYLVSTEWLPPDRPFTTALIRTLPAGLLLLLWQRQLPQRHEWLKIGLLSFLNISAFQALLFISAYHLAGGQAAVVSSIAPLFLMLLVALVDKQKIKRPAILAGGAIVVGMALLMLAPNLQWNAIGVFAALTNALSLALGIWLTHRWRLSLSIFALTGWQLFLGGLTLIPLSLAFDPALPTLTHSQILAYGYLTLFGGVIAYVLWFRGMQTLSPVAVEAIGMLSPIGAILLGWLVLGQSITGIGLIGLFIVLISVFLLQRYGRS